MTRAGRRRLHDRRMSAYRQFGAAHDWDVLGLHQDLSQRYPVAPLLGARSAQAELALIGQWDGWSAVIASVLVRPTHGSGTRTSADVTVQLTTLDTGPILPQFTAGLTPGGPDIALLSGDAVAPEPLDRILRTAQALGHLWLGDQVAADEVELLHTRMVNAAKVDFLGPLRLLSALARELLSSS